MILTSRWIWQQLIRWFQKISYKTALKDELLLALVYSLSRGLLVVCSNKVCWNSIPTLLDLMYLISSWELDLFLLLTSVEYLLMRRQQKQRFTHSFLKINDEIVLQLSQGVADKIPEHSFKILQKRMSGESSSFSLFLWRVGMWCIYHVC